MLFGIDDVKKIIFYVCLLIIYHFLLIYNIRTIMIGITERIKASGLLVNDELALAKPNTNVTPAGISPISINL
jgi:hypothetical protein